MLISVEVGYLLEVVSDQYCVFLIKTGSKIKLVSVRQYDYGFIRGVNSKAIKIKQVHLFLSKVVWYQQKNDFIIERMNMHYNVFCYVTKIRIQLLPEHQIFAANEGMNEP